MLIIENAISIYSTSDRHPFYHYETFFMANKNNNKILLTEIFQHQCRTLIKINSEVIVRYYNFGAEKKGTQRIVSEINNVVDWERLFQIL